MSTIVKYIKAEIDENKKVVLYLPDIANGEVEVVIIKKEEKNYDIPLLSLIPKHKMGKILTSMRREDIYSNER